MPMYHIGGGAVTSFGRLAYRGTFVILPGFDPALMLEVFETYRGTHTLVVPTMLIALLEHLNAAGTTIIIVITHDHTIATRLPRRIDMLDGRIVADTAGDAQPTFTGGPT